MEQAQSDRQGEHFRILHEDGGYDVFVPCRGEGKQGRDHEALSGNRDDHAPENFRRRATIHGRRFLDRFGDAVVERLHLPDAKRQNRHEVNEDEPEKGVDQFELHEDEENREQQHRGRKNLGDEQPAQKRQPAEKAEPRERVTGRGRNKHPDDGHSQSDEQRIAQPAQKVRRGQQLPEVDQARDTAAGRRLEGEHADLPEGSYRQQRG